VRELLESYEFVKKLQSNLYRLSLNESSEDGLDQDAGSKSSSTEKSTRTGRRPLAIPLEKRFKLLNEPPRDIKSVLQSYLVQEVALSNWISKRPVLIGDNGTIERVLSRLNNHNILSMPVVDQNKGVIGIIDVLDLTSAVNHALKSKSTVNIQNRIRNDFMNRTVGNLLSQKESKMYEISTESNLYSAIQHMIKLKQERFLIVEKSISGEVAEISHPEPTGVDGLLTQSDILRFLAQNVMLLSREPHFQKSLQELGIGYRKPKIVPLCNNVAQTFMDMGVAGLHGVAIVDHDGKLFANLSASDLKGMTRKNCVVLNSTIAEFLKKDRKRGWWVRPIIVDRNSSLFHLMLLFVSSKVHRIYVIDDDGKPVGEINHTDILSEVLKL